MPKVLSELEPTAALWITTGGFGFLTIAFLLLRVCTSAVTPRLMERAQSGDRDALELLASWPAARSNMIGNVLFAVVCGVATALLARQDVDIPREQLQRAAYCALGICGLQLLFLLGALFGAAWAGTVSRR